MLKFLGGFVTGVIVTILGLLLIGFIMEVDDDLSYNMFDEKGECIEIDGELKIVQGYTSNKALAQYEQGFMDYVVVLLIDPKEKNSFYDDKIIKIPNGMCARQYGTYQYEAKSGVMKTVPVVAIE
jgi:hypothetical protein